VKTEGLYSIPDTSLLTQVFVTSITNTYTGVNPDGLVGFEFTTVL